MGLLLRGNIKYGNNYWPGPINKQLQKFAFILVLFFFIGNSVLSQLNQLFTYYNQVQGLPDNNVKAIAQDKYGYIWIGTENGLTRFDGKYFTSFALSNSMEQLPSMDIYGLQNIDSNHLGVVTRRGLQIINIANMTSVNIIVPKGPLAYIEKANHLRRVHVYENGEFIIVSRSGFYHFNKEQKLVYRYDDYTNAESFNSLSFGEFSHWLNNENLVLKGRKVMLKYNVRLKKLNVIVPSDSSFLLFTIPALFSPVQNYFVFQPKKGYFVFLNYTSDSLIYVDEINKLKAYSTASIDSLQKFFTWRSNLFLLNDSTLLMSGKFKGLYTLKFNQRTGKILLDTTAFLKIKNVM